MRRATWPRHQAVYPLDLGMLFGVALFGAAVFIFVWWLRFWIGWWIWLGMLARGWL